MTESKELFKRVDFLMQQLIGNENKRQPPHIINEMFFLHNLAFPHKPSYSKSCGGCRMRTYQRLLAWYEQMKEKYT